MQLLGGERGEAPPQPSPKGEGEEACQESHPKEAYPQLLRRGDVGEECLEATSGNHNYQL